MNKIYILSSKADPYAFVTQTAAEKLNISPFLLKIARTKEGKPYFENYADIHFNISHSADLLAVAISNKPVGVDIEKIRKVNLNVTKRFSDKERLYVLEKDSQNRLFEVWTKKEALLKYLGAGLSGGIKGNCVFSRNNLIKTFVLDGYYLSVCGENDFEIADKI